jgi:hypothetical protein
MDCLFCHSEGPFSSEHVIPESLGNDDLILIDQVCAKCNAHFSHKVESPVLSKSPLAFWRVFLGVKSKRGRFPSIDLSQPTKQKGHLPALHSKHDNRVGFSAHEDGSCSVDIDDPEIVGQILDNSRNTFQFIFTPSLLFDMGRFLCKVGIELICVADPARARTNGFDPARRFARFGEPTQLWPIFHFSSGGIEDLKERRFEEERLVEEIVCYSYRVLETPPHFVLSELAVGTDHWIVCLNDPFPSPVIRSAFPGVDLRLIWYAPDETV